MNPWIWIFSIFITAFLLLVYLRRTSEGFSENTKFEDKQYNFFHKLLNRGLFVNNGIQLSELNEAVKDVNLYNTIPEKEDYTHYFSQDPYKEYVDFDSSFCKSARHPKQLPNREPGKRVQCGWWYVPDASVPSVGSYGTRDGGPIVREGLPPNGQWIWDLNRAIELEDMKKCKRIKSCDLMDVEGIQGECGFCEHRGYAVPIDRNGNEKYPDSSDACGEPTVGNVDKCFRPAPPELITDDGINCGTYGRPSIDGSLRLYTTEECNKLNGTYIPTGECLIKTGGSYSTTCSGLNTVATEPRICDPDPKGNLTRQCLISLTKGMGYNQSGAILRMLMGNMGPNQTDKYAMDILKNQGIVVPDALLGAGNIDKESAGRIYSSIYNAMNSGTSNIVRQAAKWLVSGTDTFDICEFEPTSVGPFPLQCLQREFRQAGCQPAGSAHPSNNSQYQGFTWSNISKKFKDLYQSMQSTDSEIQRKATEDCLGIKFYKAADQVCCFIMYGPWIGSPGKIDRIDTLTDGKKVYIKMDGGFTKMVHQSGEGRYYSGNISQFNPNNWNIYNVAPQGVYNVRRGTTGECPV